MKDKIIFITVRGLMILIILIGLCFIGLMIYLKIKYANTPVGELPSWAFWLIGR